LWCNHRKCTWFEFEGAETVIKLYFFAGFITCIFLYKHACIYGDNVDENDDDFYEHHKNHENNDQ
jgi:hypothetical protein